MIVDRDPERVEQAIKAGMLAVQADSTLDETLHAVGVTKARGLIAALGTDADNLFVILSAKTLNPLLNLAARVAEEEAEQKLRRAGADAVFAPYAITGHRLAQALLRPHVSQFLDFTDKSLGLDVAIEQVRVGDASEYVSKSLQQTQLRRDLGVVVLAIRKSERRHALQSARRNRDSGRRLPHRHGPARRPPQARKPAHRGARMKVLTAAQMREVDRRTQELGIPGLILMENAGQRVVEFLERAYAPLYDRRIVIFCGKGNNGGDGMVIARQLFTRVHPRSLDVVLAADPAQFTGDAAENFAMLSACGCPYSREITSGMRTADLVVDALLGTGVKGPASGAILDFIREINTGFPLASVVAVDIPSGLPSDAGLEAGEYVRAHHTVTFTAPKVAQVLPPYCDCLGALHVVAIGTPAELYENDPSIFLSLIEREQLGSLFGPRARGANKGDFGHVVVIAGSRGKTGAAAMAGMAALRAGAGLVTVATAESAVAVVAAHAPELMTEPLAETAGGGISLEALESGRLPAFLANKDVVAIGPGLGTNPETVEVVRRLVAECTLPMVVDADALNALAGTGFRGRALVLTPHPGEMSRLAGASIADHPGRSRGRGPALRHRARRDAGAQGPAHAAGISGWPCLD